LHTLRHAGWQALNLDSAETEAPLHKPIDQLHR
jgi:hypothetical protein